MKKLCIILALLALCTTQSYGQKWLQKIGKALEKVNETLETANDVLDGNTSNSSSSSQQQSGQTRGVTQNVNGISIETPSSVFAVQPISCQREGNDVLFVFMLQNNGNDISRFTLMTSPAVLVLSDNQGNSYPAGIAMGGRIPSSSYDYWADGALPSGVPTKVTMKIIGVSKNANQLAIIQFRGSFGNQQGNFTFRNVPIVTPEVKTVATGMFITTAGAGPFKFGAVKPGQVGDYKVELVEDDSDGNYYLATNAQDEWVVRIFSSIMEVLSPDFQTEKGIRAGMTLAEVQKAMGSGWNPGIFQYGNYRAVVVEHSPKIGLVIQASDLKDGGAAFDNAYQKGTDYTPRLSDFKTNAKISQILIQK